METESYSSICIPARFCKERSEFETISAVVDIENDRIELISENRENTIRLDLIGANELSMILQELSNDKCFQAALRKKIEKQSRRYNAVDRTGL